MVLGGGGYTIRNVARCWCYETAIAVGVDLQNNLPQNEFYEYYGPDFTLNVPPSNMENQNSPKDLEKIKNNILDRLSRIESVPSAPFQDRLPNREIPEAAEEDMDQR
ncbi:hypothetical protein IFM89_006996 [Coptis chinensis]|uniref:Histone deacetylase n=1 Tax=Coptis chinensis TaxID=261450 RepID=A0A835MD62_9MAGN|nr:hypothetical protein IFM89_006996 [Coptis chinensis]